MVFSSIIIFFFSILYTILSVPIIEFNDGYDSIILYMPTYVLYGSQ